MVALLALMAEVVPADAFTTLDAAYGTPLDAETPRAAAMGSVGASLFQGSGSLVSNPALLPSLGERGLVELNLGLLQANEDRFQPLYDSFESYVTETTIATNRSRYGMAQGGGLFRLSPERAMVLGLGIYDRYVFDYDYFEEIRDPSPFVATRDAVIQLRSYKIDGRLRSVTGGYGMELIPRLALGLSIHRYFGTLDHEVRTTTTDAYQGWFDSDPGSSSFAQDLGGWGWTVGILGTINERVDVGASFEGPFTAEGTLTSPDSTLGSWVPYDKQQTILVVDGGDVQVKYPGTLRVGATLRPRNLLSTTFSFEGVRRFWEKVDEDGYRTAAFTSAGALRDTWDVRIGLEHVFYNKVPARFGFRYLENYADRESARSIYSAGVGYEVGGFGVDVGLQYHRQTTRQDYLFDRTLEWVPDPPRPLEQNRPRDEAPEGLSKVEDAIVSLILGVSRGF